ncbi:ABC transporter ATP-binding protein/permease [Labrys sp. KB_33_2]|uniref:ABC transporter ATP-binding protein/permease n=1 Tax=Labrys sp. KB_33_2 TaxID=3237479 RepID=UPI003F8E0EB7
MPRIFSQIWRLLRLCVAGPGGRTGLALLTVVLGLNLGSVYVSLLLIDWNAQFYGALEKRDAAAAVNQIGVFGLLIAVNAAMYLAAVYLRKSVQIRWRHALTAAALDRWLGGRTHARLRQAGATPDNPDQRIAEDCRLFVDKFTEEGLEVVTSIVGLVSYVALLWSLSSFPLAFTLFGVAVEIPRYMVWAAPVYVLISSGLTHWLGRPLLALNAQQQSREADFRFALARLREFSDAVALMAGEAAERRVLDARFGAIMRNWRALMNRDLILGCFTRPYHSTVLRIPIFLALPAYLAGQVALGGLMKLASAFQNVVTTLSWFIFSYRNLAELAAAIRRLDGFLDALGRVTDGEGVRTRTSGLDHLSIQGLALATPEGRALNILADMRLERGENAWLAGASGIGKSTLIKAMAGLWPHGEGRVTLPAERRIAFLPQAVYLPLADLRTVLAYPQDPGMLPRQAYAEALQLVGLEHRLPGLDDGELPLGLSGGEQQRLALARLILARPDWAVLDEPTSALDSAAEAHLFAALRAALPHTSFVVVAHREPAGLGSLRRIELEPYTLEVVS